MSYELRLCQCGHDPDDHMAGGTGKCDDGERVCDCKSFKPRTRGQVDIPPAPPSA